MTIARKLTRIAENSPKVYDKGYEDGQAVGYNEGYENGYADGLEEDGYTKGYEQGKKAEYDAFWDAYQENGARTQYNGAFYGEGWHDDNFKPKYDIAPVRYGCSSTFFQCRVTDLVAALDRQGVKLDFSQVHSLSSAFQASSITKIPPLDLSSAITCGNAFYNCNNLKAITLDNIKEVCDFAKTFTNCTELTDVTLSGTVGQDIGFQHSTKLTADSIRSIITHLSDTAQGKTLTLSRTAVDNMDISDVHVSTTGPFATTNGTFLPTCELQMKAGERIRVTLDVAEGHHYTDFNSAAQPDWAVGFSFNGIEPYNRDETYTAETDGTVYINAYIQTRKACEFTFKMRAVFVDADGNEIDGENIFSIADGDYSYEDWETGAITNYTVKSDWAALEASKPNWTITLV